MSNVIVSELNHLKLSTSWNVLGSQEGNTTANTVAQKTVWDRNQYLTKDVLATVKIFSNEEEYNKYSPQSSEKILADFFNGLNKKSKFKSLIT